MITLQKVTTIGDCGWTKQIQFTTAIEWREFQALIQAGSATNPDLSPALKEFCDLVTTGKVQQDYYAQANLPRPT